MAVKKLVDAVKAVTKKKPVTEVVAKKEVKVIQEQVSCKNCRGTGRIPYDALENLSACPECNGEGVI